MIDRILISCCLFFSVLNIIFTVFLSNSIFRLLTSNGKNLIKKQIDKSKNNTNEDGGLVDLEPTVTYDPRFRNQ